MKKVTYKQPIGWLQKVSFWEPPKETPKHQNLSLGAGAGIGAGSSLTVVTD